MSANDSKLAVSYTPVHTRRAFEEVAVQIRGQCPSSEFLGHSTA
jgi:hypothetical protein